jgi:hypothetical protein
MSRDPDNLYPTEPMETTLFYRSCRRAKMRRWEHIPSERRRERTVLVLCLLLILFFSVFNLRLEDDGFIGAPDGESGQTERDGRVEQYNNSTERGPQNNEGREGCLAALFSLFSFFFFLYSSDAFGLGREGLGRQIYPWVLRLLFLIFGLLFWRLNCYIHTRRKTIFYNSCVAFDFFCVTYFMAGFSLSLTLTAAGQSTVITYLTPSQMEKRVDYSISLHS